MSILQILSPQHSTTIRRHPSWSIIHNLLGILENLKSNPQRAGWVLAFGAVTAYSTSAPIGRGAIEAGLNPTTLLMVRYVVASLLLGGMLLLTSRDSLRIDRRGLMFCGLVGLINAVTALSFFWGLVRVNASLASLLVSIYPLIVLGLLALRGEKFTYRNTVRLVLGLGGVYLIIGPGDQLDVLGLLLIFVCAIGYASQLVFTQWFLRDYDSKTISFYVVGTLTVVVFGVWLALGAEWQNPGQSGWLSIFFMGAVGTFAARLALFSAIRTIGSGQTALLAPTETMLSVLWAVLLLSEQLTFLQWLGSGLIILSAILVVNRLYRVKSPPFRRIWLRI